MQIIWHGQSFFEIIAKNENQESVRIAIDPFAESIGLKVPRSEADILICSHQHEDHNNKKAILGKPFLIEEPGEYEVKGVFVKGVLAFHDDVQGKKRGTVIMSAIEVEGIHIAHLSDLGQKELTTNQLESLGNVDVLMIPVGGVYTISAREAAEIISQIEPRIVIPMHYSIPRLKIKLDNLDKFLKVMGIENVTPERKLKLKADSLPKEEMQVVVLQPLS